MVFKSSTKLFLRWGRVWHALVKLRYKVYNSSYIVKLMIKKIMYK